MPKEILCANCYSSSSCQYSPRLAATVCLLMVASLDLARFEMVFKFMLKPVADFLKFALGVPLVATTLVANASLVLQVSDATAPPGGWVQLKIFSATPQLIAAGAIEVDLDPTVFGPVADVAAFSANGDAYGFASLLTAGGVDVYFNCGPGGTVGEVPAIGPASEGIGQARDLPIVVITVPVLTSAPVGKAVTINAQAASETGLINLASPFLDQNRNQYDVSFTPGTVTIGGSLSVQSIAPGGGSLPTGTLIQINGTGFSSATTVQVDGVSLTSTQLVSDQEIDVTLGAPAELTGKKFVIQNPEETKDFYSFLRVGAITGASVGYGYPLFPLQTSSMQIQFGSLGARNGALVIQNPNLVPADLTIQVSYGVPSEVPSAATVPAGGTWAYYVEPGIYNGSITSSQPIRAVQFYNDAGTLVSPVFPEGASAFVANYPVTPVFAPLIGSITGAASGIQGSVAPGEIITIHGTGLASAQPMGLMLDASGSVATNYGGTQVLFDGKPAPLIYSSPLQVNAIVPYEVAEQSFTNISAMYNGLSSADWGVPIRASAPSIFTLSGSGVGQAAVLNQDGSVNSSSNPAARGTVLQIFATGAGLMSPAQATGSVTQSNSPVPVLPVQVTIGGVDAPVQFVGAAPYEVAGVLQINVIAPLAAPAGQAVPISLVIGTSQSPDGVIVVLK